MTEDIPRRVLDPDDPLYWEVVEMSLGVYDHGVDWLIDAVRDEKDIEIAARWFVAYLAGEFSGIEGITRLVDLPEDHPLILWEDARAEEAHGA